MCSSDLEEGLGVLWTTHLFDETEAEDDVTVLHRGRVRWAGRVADLAGTVGLAEAFARLTGGEGER